MLELIEKTRVLQVYKVSEISLLGVKEVSEGLNISMSSIIIKNVDDEFYYMIGDTRARVGDVIFLGEHGVVMSATMENMLEGYEINA